MVCYLIFQFSNNAFCRSCDVMHFAGHVMCFICHKLLYRDADDLGIEILTETMERLQGDLADHLATAHQLQLTTGVDPVEPPSSPSMSPSPSPPPGQLSSGMSCFLVETKWCRD